MTETEKAAPKTKGGDAGQAEVQARMDEVTEQGFLGEKVDPIPDEEYSLLTGPDSPQHVADDKTRASVDPKPKEK